MNRNYNPTMSGDVFNALKSSNSRRVLTELDTEEFTSFQEIVDGLEEQSEDEKNRGSYEIELHHVVLPKLQDVGFVELQKEGDERLYRLQTPFQNSSVPGYMEAVQSSSADQIFDVFSSEDRRLIVSYMSDQDKPVSRERLVEYVAERTEEFGSRDEREVLLALHSMHIPKLDQEEFIDYDEETYVLEPDDMLYDENVQNLVESLYGDNSVSEE